MLPWVLRQRELLLHPQPGHGAGDAAGTAMALPGMERVGKLRQEERGRIQADGGCPLPATAQPCSALRENTAHFMAISGFCFCLALVPPFSAPPRPEVELNNFEFPFFWCSALPPAHHRLSLLHRNAFKTHCFDPQTRPPHPFRLFQSKTRQLQ